MTKRGYQRLFYFIVDIILCFILYKLIRKNIDKDNKKKELQVLKNKENNIDDNNKNNNIKITK